MINALFGWIGDQVGAFLGLGTGTDATVGPQPHAAPAAPSPSATAMTAPAGRATPVGLQGQGQGLVTDILNGATQEVDPTGGSYKGFLGLFGGLMDLAATLLGVLLVFGVLGATLETSFGRGSSRPWIAFFVRMMFVLVYITSLLSFAHSWAGAMGGLAGFYNHMGLSHFVQTVLGLLSPGTNGTLGGLTQGTVAVVVGALLLLVFLALALILLAQSLIYDALQCLVFVLMPVGVATLALPATRSYGLTWIRTYLAFSLRPPVLALFLQAVDGLVFGMKGDGSLGTPIVQAMTGIVAIMALMRVQSLIASTVGGMEIGRFGVPSINKLADLKFLLPFL